MIGEEPSIFDRPAPEENKVKLDLRMWDFHNYHPKVENGLRDVEEVSKDSWEVIAFSAGEDKINIFIEGDGLIWPEVSVRISFIDAERPQLRIPLMETRTGVDMEGKWKVEYTTEVTYSELRARGTLILEVEAFRTPEEELSQPLEVRDESPYILNRYYTLDSI